MGKKTKLNWKPVVLDQNMLSKSSVEGLIGIEELSDYSFKTSSDFGGKIITARIEKRVPKKKKKRGSKKQKNEEKNISEDPNTSEKRGGKRKRSIKETLNAAGSVLTKKRKILKNGLECTSTIMNKDSETEETFTPALKVKKTKSRNINRNRIQDSKKTKTLFSSTSFPKTEEAIEESQLLSVMSKWNGLFVPQPILKALHQLGFKEPTQIQVLSLPAAIKGRKDMMGAAETGSGKTLAFGIPILAGIMKAKEILETKKAMESSLSCEEEEEVEEDAEELASSKKEVKEEIMSDDKDAQGSSEDSDCSDDELDCSEENDEINEKAEGELACVRVIDNIKFPFSVVEGEREPQKSNKLWALVLTPTRELAIQVYKHLIAIAKFTSIKIAVLVGGMAAQKQERMLRRCPEIVVATPGRLWELIQSGNSHLAEVDKIRFLAVDEADRMLEAGHFQELKDLLERINKEGSGRRQNFVYSATLSLVHEVPKRVRGRKRKRQTPGQKLHSLAELIGLKDPKIVDVTPEGATAGGLVETRLTSSSLIDRDVRLASVLTYLAHSPFSAGSTSASKTIVFCNSVGGVRRLGGLLTALQLSPYLLHAGMQQRQRLRSLERFSQGGILLATDVAARGLDLPLVDHVIHFQVPRTSETYVHRSGRTARANREGLSVLLVEPKEVPLYERLCRTLGKDDGLPLFPLDEKLVNLVKERVKIAREVDFLEHQLRRSNAEGNWIQKTMKDADIILDEEEVPKKYNLDNPQLKKELKAKKKELEGLLRRTLLPMGVSPRYPTMNGKLEIPRIGAEVKTVDAVKSKLVEREKKLKIGIKGKRRPKS